MRRFGVLVIAGAAFLMACTPADEDSAAERVAVRDASAITYAQTACIGFCPVFDVTVNEAGRGVFEGREHVAQQGLREFHISSEQFEELERQLAPSARRPAMSATAKALAAKVAASRQLMVLSR